MARADAEAKRAGATSSMAIPCCAMTSGCREKVTAMEVPSRMRSVLAPMTASVVRLSGP